MFLTNLYLFIDSVFVYLSLKFIRFYEHELSNKRLHLLFLCLLKHPHSSYPSYFSNQNFFLFSNEMTVINTENVSSIFFNIKNSNVFSYFLSFKNKFLNKIKSLTPVQVNCIRLQYVSSRPFADKAKVLQSKPES